jgi:hypothetical protein
LEAYSGRSFPVALAQTGQWGQAYPGGIILLDSSVLTDEPAIMAFKYAHEWAHQLLGHVNPHRAGGPDAGSGGDGAGLSGDDGSVHALGLGQSPTQVEDEADAWAGAFLSRYAYDLDAVAAYLRAVPHNPTDTVHSPGTKRAELVLSAANR